MLKEAAMRDHWGHPIGEERNDDTPRLWAGIGVRQNVELGIGIACGFAIVSALGALIVWLVRLFD